MFGGWGALGVLGWPGTMCVGGGEVHCVLG